MYTNHTQKDLYSQDIFPVWKAPGETLALLIDRVRSERSIPPEEKITYAGRLDPMAEGVVVLLVGKSRFQKDTLLGLDKEYELTVLLGVSTDSADMLGMVTNYEKYQIDSDAIVGVVDTLTEVTSLPYPMYSSRPVQGKPLFVHARAGNAVEVPTKKVQIKKVTMLSIEQRTLGECALETLPIIETVVGDFRQKEIIDTWHKLSHAHGADTMTMATVRVVASSGTYMRSLAELVGKQLGTPALAYKIKRIKVGDIVFE